MVRRARGSKKGPKQGELWHGYRRPIRRDGVFWLAVVTTVVALAVQNPWSGLDSTARWVLFVADVLLTALITFALIGVLAGTLRGFGEGWRSAERPGGAARPTPAPLPLPLRPRLRLPGPSPSPSPAQVDPVPDADRPLIGVELEKRARALGRAIGATQRKTRKP